jgi:soluble lytic murein transglycosylase
VTTAVSRFLFILALAAPAALPVAGIAHGTPLSASDEAIYRSAFASADAGKWTAARTAAGRAKDPRLAKVLEWLDYQEPGRGGTFTELDRFLANNPDWPQLGMLRREAERQMPSGRPPQDVVAWFSRQPPLTGAGAHRLAEALFALGRTAEARSLVRTAWIELPFSATEERSFAAAFPADLHPADHVQRLDRLIWQRDEAAARRMFVRVDAGTRALAEARLAVQDLHRSADTAIKRVPRILQEDPGLLYERARWRRRKEQYESVVELLDRPPFITPFLEQVWLERDDAARRALDRGEARTAYRLAKNHGLSSGPAFAEGEFLAGWISLRRLNDAPGAFDHFKRLYAGVNSPISLARGAYWAGRAAEAMGDVPEARGWYMDAAQYLTTFYGQLAAEQIGIVAAPSLSSSPAIGDEDRRAYRNKELAVIARQLAQIGEDERVRPFLVRLAGNGGSATNHLLVAELAVEIGRPDLALATAKNARGAVELVEHLFPLRELTGAAGPEQALVLAIIRQESAFDTGAVSPAGARGLMQIMPATARTMAARSGIAFSRDRLLDDPDYNLRLGSAYLHSLVQDYGGSYLLSLAAYNAGPTRVRDWLAANGDPRDQAVDAVDWVELIPLSETRNYVQRVLETLAVYRHRLDGDDLAITLAEDLKR